MIDIYGERIGVLDQWVSETGVHLYWATTVFFSKNKQSKIFFDLVENIKQNYKYYSDLYRFDNRRYRNDISFSIAKHILDGFEHDFRTALPKITTVIDKDILHEVNDKNLIFMINNPKNQEKFVMTSTNGVDIHVMNKQSIIRNCDKLLKL
jgi:hypothetical protein